MDEHLQYNDVHNDRYKEEVEGAHQEGGVEPQHFDDNGFRDSNIIYIGMKPFMNYVTGVVMQFATKGAQEVVVKARGKFISRAVDVAEVAAKRFLKGEVVTKNIVINSEQFTNREGREVRVSTIEITLGKK